MAEQVAETVSRIVGEGGSAAVSETAAPARLEQSLDELETELLVRALKATRGNKAKAARMLGVTERVMGLRLRKHGINYREFRNAS